MDKGTLRTRVRRQSLVTTAELTDGQIDQDLEQGVLDVATQYAWPWMKTVGTISLVNGTTTYSLPADLMYLENLIHDGEGRAQLERTTLSHIKAVYGDSVGDSDLPHLWYQEDATQVTFVPTPNAAKTVNVHYYAEPDIDNDFDEDTEVPPWAAPFHLLLVDYALAQIWEREEVFDRAQYYWQRYYQAVERMALFYSQQLPSPPLVVGGGISAARLRKPFSGWPEV